MLTDTGSLGSNSGCKSGGIATRLGIPNPTVKRILSELVKLNFIEKHSDGPGTNYSIKSKKAHNNIHRALKSPLYLPL
ncbi:MAG: helix-turn-helix domain-containing protein [Bacteroidetes bacterium]|nr:helix-turn-helix domain-containing protein [Bacteroidota bacterium]MBT3749425.1 helix-turn-helix domain-containing protein [Bacteroidota bacterium]MBT4400611.1 helix-turn-helix domain-containing protein [Bacteroidota bacterium]MBT4408363.1 helix-turn-helix domain-containing protein [Bacteroidota bacterium]MBT5426899.1 helix-turn-helix domain-containing protein [Bacteroidota bacterium]